MSIDSGEDPGMTDQAAVNPIGVATSVLSGKRCFAVEDEGVTLLHVTRALLSARGALVGTADTEDDAVAGVLSLQPDLVVMDLLLRQGDGVGATRRILAGFRTCIVGITGLRDGETTQHASEAGMCGIIRKPFSGQEFITALAVHYSRFLASGAAGPSAPEGVRAGT